jgi:hypothetical protein
MCLQVAGASDDKVLIMGATNRPQELDDAVLRLSFTPFFIFIPYSPFFMMYLLYVLHTILQSSVSHFLFLTLFSLFSISNTILLISNTYTIFLFSSFSNTYSGFLTHYSLYSIFLKCVGHIFCIWSHAETYVVLV